MNILYADDDFLTVQPDRFKEHLYYEALDYALQEAGIPDPIIDVATSGGETLEKLCATQFDGLILDIMMPHGDDAPDFIKKEPIHKVGLLIAKALSNPSVYKIQSIFIPNKVLILTATPMEEDRKILTGLCLERASWEFMHKPTTFERIASFFKKEG